jgi:hypothetical protein
MVTKLRIMGLTGYVACTGCFRNYMICRSEKLNGRENSIKILVHNSMEEMSWDDWT